MKRFLVTLLVLFTLKNTTAQVLYGNSLGNLTLQTYTATNAVVQYTSVPSSFSIINDGLNNNVGTTSNPNSPFNVPALKTSGWAVSYNALQNDTFLVSTSWLDTALASSRWVITPTVTNITANTVLTWMAMSPDPSYRDGYEVYGTNKTGTLTANDFTIGDKLFSIGDASTSEGGEKSSWYRRSIPLGSFAGQTLRFAFRNNSNNMFQLWIDDIEVKTLSKNLDGGVNSIDVKKYILINSADTIFVNYTNFGSATINTVTLNYTYGSSSINSQAFTISGGLNYGQSTTLKFALPYSFSSPGYFPVKCWASLANNLQDQDLTNDTVITYVTALNTSPQRNILLEQFVSANDPETPDAQEKIMSLANNSQYIVVNIHNNDSLTEANSAGVISTYKKKNSTAMINRVFFNDLNTNTVDRPYYKNKADSQATMATPVSVSIINKSYNSGTQQLSFTVKADFVGEVKGDYRIAAYLAENWVCGKGSDTTVNGYNQLSNYFNVPWSPYYQTGYFSSALNTWVLKANQYKHKRTVVHTFDGGFGNAGVIPQTGGTTGQSYQVNYTLTLPTSTNGASIYNADNIYIVGFAAEYSSNVYNRNILNCVQDKLTANGEVVGIKDTYLGGEIAAYPNPATNFVNIKLPAGINKYEVNIYDVSGRVILTKLVENTGNTETIDTHGIRPGIYFISVKTGDRNLTQKIIIENN